MTDTLRRNIIGLIISALLFSAAIVLIYSLYTGESRVSTEDADVIITNIILDEDYNALLQWDCANTNVTSYQVFSMNEQGKKNYLTSTMSTRRYYRAQTSKGGFFTYAVRAYNSNTEEATSSELSPCISVLVDPGKPVSDIADFIPVLTFEDDNGKVRLKWDRPVNCLVSSYCIYRKSADGDWEVAKVTAPYATAYTDDRSSGEYKLVARSNQNGELLTSHSSEVVIAEVQDE